MDFTLHPILEVDTYPLFELPLSSVLLMNDSRFPWLILVPKRAEISEIYELSKADQILLWQEVTAATKWAQAFFKADKMNVATLGNVVPQLHIHIIARKKGDSAWPKPVWGNGSSLTYTEQEIKCLLKKIESDDACRKCSAPSIATSI